MPSADSDTEQQRASAKYRTAMDKRRMQKAATGQSSWRAQNTEGSQQLASAESRMWQLATAEHSR